MRFFLVLTLLCIAFRSAYSQQIEIGMATNQQNNITSDTAILQKAISRTIPGGLQITQLRIESVGTFHYLIAQGRYRGMAKTAAMVLRYNIYTRVYYAQQGDGYVSCTSAACLNCTMFKENGRVIGCKCEEKSTISNQCNFTKVDTSAFYQNLVRAKTMRK
jgi:hypothetical protein